MDSESWERLMFFTLVAFVLYNVFLVIYSVQIGNFYAIKGQAGFTILALGLFYFRKELKMGAMAFLFISGGFAVHLSHVLGKLYQNTSLLVPWDYLSHGVFFIGAAIYFFGLRKKEIDVEWVFCFENWFLLFTLFLTVSGIGVLIELGEYSGYVFLEDGGYEIFGGGDYEGIVITDEVISDIEFHGGGWFDAMTDFVVNSVAALGTLLVMFVWYVRSERKRLGI